MKIKKFLSIVGDITNGIDPTYSYSADEAYDFLLTLEDGLKEGGIHYTQEEKQQPQGTLHLKVVNEEGVGIPIEVKIFPVHAHNGQEDTQDKIEFTRLQTDLSGEVQVNLRADQGYRVRLSKGFEYEIIEKFIELREGQKVDVTIELKRLINLQEEGWYPGDLHHHSIYSSPVHGGTDPVVETVAQVYHSMQATGLVYGALSDHHNVKNHREWEAVETKTFIPILSKEISTSNGHVMALGVDQEVTYNIPEEDVRSQEIMRNEFLRVVQEIKNLGGMPQINHPRETNASIAFPLEFIDMIHIFETMEIWNGSNPMLKGTTNYKAVELWIELLKEGRYIPATTGSDTHNIKANDYNEMLEKLTWLMKQSNENRHLFSEEVQEQLKNQVPKCKKAISLVAKWAKENVGTGGVRTYVYVPEALNAQSILTALKKGNSFLTNGPLLIPSMEGHIPGQVMHKQQEAVTISIKLVSQKPLDTLELYTNEGLLHKVKLETDQCKGQLYDYSHELMNIDLKDSQWIVFKAASDHTNLVITNPIFIER